MTVAAYRDQATGRYPITLDEIRASAAVLFGDMPPQSVLDDAGVDAVTAVAPPGFDPATQTLTEGEPALQGGIWHQTWKLAELTTEASAPNEIADWQFATVLAEDGIISQAEAEDFAGAGVIPPAMETAISSIADEALRRRTRIKVRGAKTYILTDPATVLIASLLGYVGEAVADIWRRGSAVA